MLVCELQENKFPSKTTHALIYNFLQEDVVRSVILPADNIQF